MPLFFCDHCGREVPADKDGTCCNVDCVNQALEDQRLTELEADMDWAENHQPDIGGESG